MPDIRETAAELESIARHLRRAGQDDLRKSLLKAVSGAVRPVGDDVKAGLERYMPDAYARELRADLKVTTSARLSGDDPQVSLTGRPGSGRRRALRRLEDGTLGHPVYGIRDRYNPRRWAAWVFQTSHVRPGWFSEPARAAVPRVRDAIGKALGDVAERATRKGA